MRKITPKISGTPADAIFSVIEACGIPTPLLQGLFKKRMDTLRSIISKEIRTGDFSNVDQDEFVSICYRLSRDAMEGTARNNLHFLCRIIQGMYDKKELRSSCFLRYASILSALSEDEIIVLGLMSKYHPFTSAGDYNDCQHAAKEALGVKDIEPTQQALVRTGLVAMEMSINAEDGRPAPAKIHRGDNLIWSAISQATTNSYYLTPLMEEVLKYTNFNMEIN